MVKFIYKDISDSEHRITVTVGHDSNIAALFSALDIKKYTLEKQSIGKKKSKNRVCVSINRTAQKWGTVRFEKSADEKSTGNGRMSC